MTITIENATNVVKQLIEERGEDYRYRKAGDATVCKYAQHGEPSCVVGHVIAKLNPELFAEVAEAEKKDGFSVYSFGDEYDNYPKPDWDYATGDFLQHLQVGQDRGNTWAVSLEYALRGEEAPPVYRD